MLDPQILDVLGVEVEIRAWRGTANLYEAHLKDADGNAINLSDSNVSMVVVARSGGPVIWEHTNEPGDHTDEANGITRFLVPASVFEELTGQRTFTWKYHVVRTYLPTSAQNIYFYGDMRVYAPGAPIPAP